jgi:hypothetical protein
MAGILITKGITPGFPPGTLKIDLSTGEINATLHLHLDVVPMWLRHGFGSFQRAMIAWREAKKQLPDTIAVELLEQDFEQSMIAVMCFAIAIEAFYARLIHLNAPPAGARVLKSRYAHVTAQILRCFSLSNLEARGLRSALKQLYKLRDGAVHPVGKLTPAVLYPEIDRGVEYRFALYRAKNVSGVAQDVFNIFYHLANKAPVRAKLVGAVCPPLAVELNLMVVEFGDVLERC